MEAGVIGQSFFSAQEAVVVAYNIRRDIATAQDLEMEARNVMVLGTI
jgi:hypothetical protein